MRPQNGDYTVWTCWSIVKYITAQHLFQNCSKAIYDISFDNPPMNTAIKPFHQSYLSGEFGRFTLQFKSAHLSPMYCSTLKLNSSTAKCWIHVTFVPHEDINVPVGSRLYIMHTYLHISHTQYIDIRKQSGRQGTQHHLD